MLNLGFPKSFKAECWLHIWWRVIKYTWESGKVSSLAPITGKHKNQLRPDDLLPFLTLSGVLFFSDMRTQHFRSHLAVFQARLITADKVQWVHVLWFFLSYYSHMSYLLNPHVLNFLHHCPIVGMSVIPCNEIVITWLLQTLVFILNRLPLFP